MKNDRLFQMLYLLLEKGSMTAPELSRHLEVSIRTIYRDVDTLSMAGVPVYATVGKGGGISILPGYTFDKSLLSDEDQNQLLFAVQSLQAADQQMDDLLQKLGSVFQKPKINWIAVDFSRWGFHQVDTQNFELLKTAILGRHVLDLTYFGSSGQQSHRTIHPVRLVYKEKHWYLQGYCLKADDFRLFKISRIFKLVDTGETFSQDYTDKLPPIETESSYCNVIPIKLRFSPQIAFRVHDELGWENITTEADGSLITSLRFPLDSWIIRYLFSFGTDVEILEPAQLRTEVYDYAKKIAEHHKT